MTEASLIKLLLKHSPTGGDWVTVGPGDDAAVFKPDGSVVATTDSLIEGVHFERGWLTPEDLAWRLVGVNLSDLAAMAAIPKTALLSLAGGPEDFTEGFAQGLGAALRSAGLALIGGNVSASPGPMMLTLAVTGTLDWPVLRSGAAVGDGLWVSGRLGRAGAGLAALMAGCEEQEPDVVTAWRRPPNRIDLARQLRRTVSSLMDLSDGLAADLPRLCEASGVGATVIVDDVPGHAAFKLTAGEDYELLAAAPSHQDLGDLGMTRIGQIEAAEGVRFVDADGDAVEPGPGFDHLGPG